MAATQGITRQRRAQIARHVAAVQARTHRLYGGARMEGEGTEADRAAAAKAEAEKAAADAKAAAEAAAKGAGGGGGGKDDGEPTEQELAALGDAGRRALERVRAQRDELKAQAEAAAEKARKYDESVEANKTEQQRKDDAAAEAARVAAESTHKLHQLEAALEAGLPHTAAARLVGKDKAELLKDAKAYKAELDANAPTRTRRTTSDADAGGDGPTGGMSALIRRQAGRRA